MGNYKRLLSQFQSEEPVTNERIERCLANQAANEAKQAAALTATSISVLQKRQSSLNRKKQSRAKKADMSITEWEDQAKKYYTIDPATFAVTSVARSPDTDKAKTWACQDMIEAEEKILELIDYKFYDHSNRGYDFKYTKS